MTTAINKDINALDPAFRKKFDARRAEVKSKHPNAEVFETRRSQERQNWLYASGRTRPWPTVTRTLTSNHFTWKAVDIVFYQNWQPTRSWPYDSLIEMAKKYWIRNLKPKETCHFEDDGTPYNPQEVAPVDPLLQRLIADWIWNGKEWDGVTNRIALLIAKAKYT